MKVEIKKKFKEETELLLKSDKMKKAFRDILKNMRNTQKQKELKKSCCKNKDVDNKQN